MEHFYDELSKSLAASVPRRESLRRMGAVFAGAVLSPLGLGTAWGRGPDPCKAFCNQCPQQQRSQCLAACQACNGNTGRVCGSCGAYACCAKGTSCCGGYCADLANDFYHCGSCAPCRAPALYEAGGRCVGGACEYWCVDGAVDCNGRCTPVDSDPNNCGACGNVCAAPTPYCNEGACSVCGPWLTDCGGYCADLRNDNANCGACGNVCGVLAPYCNQGTCSIFKPDTSGCPARYTKCCSPSLIPFGPPQCNCYDLQTNTENCGACGRACASGQSCGGGYCL